MAKIRSERGYRFIKELGGAIRRSTVSFAAEWLVREGHVMGRVLDFGCGFGFDADHYGWEAVDPYYRQQDLQGPFDTIICNHVVNMLTRASRKRTIHQIQGLLATEGVAFLIVPRNIPVTGKVALRKRIQNFVVLTLPSVYADRKLEIYRLGKETEYVDRTDELERRLSRS